MKNTFAFVLVLVLCVLAEPAGAWQQPNIVLILCDDLGYGDVQCLNPEHGKIATPSIDQLARNSMTFTDAHSASSVCTPTRYGLLTGRYCWRTRLQKGVVQGFEPCLISEVRPTVATFLKSQGYHTGIIGKWHLDCRFLDPQTGEDLVGDEFGYTAPVGAMVPDGPVHRGFDYFLGVHHARSMTAVIENNRVIEHDDPANFLPRITTAAVEYINLHAQSESPFLLYLPLSSPHTPIVPTTEWEGKSGLGKYGDFVMQTDHVVGEVMNALEANGIADNTLVIFTSDNGCSKAAGIEQLARQGHRVSAHLRGSKADIWDGGHRVPFIVRWPGMVEPESVSEQLICLNDVFATLADVLEQTVPAGSCEDSVSFLPALSGQSIETERAGIIHHSVSGHFAYRQGNWKLILARASGGWSSPKEKDADPAAPAMQLYDMRSDAGEQINLCDEQPERVEAMLRQLTDDVSNGRSTPGPDSANDVDAREIRLWKSNPNEPEPRATEDSGGN